MAHNIDFSNSRANIAYVGAAPWHGLGVRLQPGADAATWARQAGLDFRVLEAPVEFRDASGTMRAHNTRKVLYRGDTHAPLSVVGTDYVTVQPSDIIEFLARLIEHAGFEMETAGSLLGGAKIWALARVNDGAPVIGHDVVRPYILAATSYDGSLATTFKFTAIRVVCDNTLTMSAGGRAFAANGGQTEADKTDGAVVQCVRVVHSTTPDYEDVRRRLGIVLTAWDRFLVQARLLAETRVNEAFVAEYLRTLLRPQQKDAKVEETRAYKRVMQIVRGEGDPVRTLPEASGTAWGVLNAVTWYVDHERGRPETGLNSAWFGSGDALKKRALELLVDAAL